MKPHVERTFLIDTKRKIKMQSINRLIWRSREEELSYTIRFWCPDFSEGFSLVVIPAVYHFWRQQNPLPVRYESGTGTGWFSIRYSLGGPRLPNTSIVINVPVLQQGHFLSKVFVFASGLFTFNSL
jgi:hypothetical protein